MKYMILLGALSVIAAAQTTMEWMTLNGASTKAARPSTLLRGPVEPGNVEPTATSNSPVIRQQIERFPISFELTPARCSLLPAITKGSGQGRLTITIAKNANGTNNYAFIEEASGMASDNQGHTYIFLFTNKSYIDSEAGIPNPKPPFNFYGPQTFQLIPVNGGASFTTSIFFKGRIRADGSFVDQGTIATPNSSCDPAA